MDGMTEMAIEEGKAAPAFTLEDAAGNAVSLKDFRGKDVIVYFYPKDDTPGCTKEACGFRDLWGELSERGAVVLVDAAQAVAHTPIDVQALDCDFLAFSGHKLYGPTGVGVLYGRRELLEEMPPVTGGGDMIRSVAFEGSTYAELPNRLEAGTPNIAGVIGLGAAIDYVQGLGFDWIQKRERRLLRTATEALQAIDAVRVIGTAADKAPVLSFVVGDIHPHDLGTIADDEGVAIRTGHHCAQPVMERFGVPATARASFAFYNTGTEIGALTRAIDRTMEVFA